MTTRNRPFLETRNGRRIRVRWPGPDGRILSSTLDENGAPFAGEAEALRYGWEQMGQIARGQWHDPRRSAITLTEWATMWWVINNIDGLAPKTGVQYRRDLELHILPEFGDYTLAELADADVQLSAWVAQHATRYASSTTQTRRDLLSTVLNDAVEAGRMTRNPLSQRRRRGRRSGRVVRPPEKAWATPLQVLLIAERSALYARDVSAFVLTVTLAYTGMRLREAVGLERRHVNPSHLTVRWQLVENKGGATRDIPKNDSRRHCDLPPFLWDLLQVEMGEHSGECGCDTHDGGPFVFGPGPRHTPHLSSGTVERRFNAAARSVYQSRGGPRPVQVRGEPFPGLPTTDRRRGDACWVPILPTATPHSLRHSHRVWMDDDNVPEVLKHDRLGHLMDGIRAVYSHITPEMRERLCEALTARWEQSLTQRAALHPRSPVPLLDRLLQEHAQRLCSPGAPPDVVVPFKGAASVSA